MKNIIIAIILATLVGFGIYYAKSTSHHGGGTHSHEGGEPHSH
jgi:hypothetical protein